MSAYEMHRMSTRREVRLKVDDGRVVTARDVSLSAISVSFLKDTVQHLLGYGRKTAFYFHDFVNANRLQYAQFGTEYHNVLIFKCNILHIAVSKLFQSLPRP